MKPNFTKSTNRLRILCAILGIMCSHMILSAQQLRFGMADYSQTYTSTAGGTTTAGGGWGSFDFGIETWTYGSGALISNYHRRWADSASEAYYNHAGQGYTWTWDTANAALVGADVVDWKTNVAYYANPFRTSNDVSYTNYSSPGSAFDSGLRFGAANGSYSPPDNSYVVTVSTMGAIYTEGLPGSTNEHFYRVKLSLSQLDQTPILTTSVQSILGKPVDGDGNAYMWLQDGSLHQGKPVFKPGVNPSFYYYTAEPHRADQLWGLTIATIKMGGSATWPGDRPAQMAQHMGYPSDEGYFSDDQLALDYILNSPLSSIFEALINAALDVLGFPVWYEKDRSRGQVSTLTDDERKYMVMALLARSTNPDPPVELDDPNLNLFVGTNFAYRLVNEFGIEAAGYNSKFAHAVSGRHVQRKRAEIGKTKIEFKEDVIVRLKIWPGTPAEYLLELGFDKADVNTAMHNASGLWFMTNSPGAGHNTIQGGAKGSPSVSFICSGRAGPVLVALEQPLLRKMPPDFFCWTRYRVTDTSVGKEHELSLNTNTTWPTFFTYAYDFTERKYLYQPPEHNQIDTPFDGFLSLGP